MEWAFVVIIGSMFVLFHLLKLQYDQIREHRKMLENEYVDNPPEYDP